MLGIAGRDVMKQVLIVDDSKLMREMVAACLRPLGEIDFVFAATGLEAIERLALAGFDLLVLDLDMPDLGGLEVTQFVRAEERFHALPILVVTSRGDEASRTKLVEAGASGFLTKPFAPHEILEEARALLGRDDTEARNNAVVRKHAAQ
jgi:two-component system, chemotaxis family, chemotaxis protein CheY